ANINIFDAKTNLYGSEAAVQMINDELNDFQYKPSSLKRNNEKANIAYLFNDDRIKKQHNQKDSTFELLTKESLNTDEDLIIGNFKGRELLLNWKLKNNILCDDLAYYNILDLTPGTNSDFVKSYLSSEVYNKLITHEPTIQERDYNEIKAFINNMIKVTDFKKSVVEYYLLTQDFDLKKNDKENCSNGRKIDIVWATKPLKIEFVIAEISGPPNEHQHSHYFTQNELKSSKALWAT
ncbi:16917_t:CDS:2, partial [Racocetra persica]